MESKLILVIDDDVELCELLRIALESKGLHVAAAKDGEEGLKIALKKKPDAIILDIKMPKMNGYEFLSRLRKEPRISATPVIVFTSLTDASSRTDEEWAQSLEVCDFVTKPIEPFLLVERIEKVLAREAA